MLKIKNEKRKIYRLMAVFAAEVGVYGLLCALGTTLVLTGVVEESRCRIFACIGLAGASFVGACLLQKGEKGKRKAWIFCGVISAVILLFGLENPDSDMKRAGLSAICCMAGCFLAAAKNAIYRCDGVTHKQLYKM